MYANETNEMATVSDAIVEWRYNVGQNQKDRAWILSDYDTWERNPYYDGPAVPHPESAEYEDECAAEARAEAADEGSPEPERDAPDDGEAALEAMDEDLPF